MRMSKRTAVAVVAVALAAALLAVARAGDRPTVASQSPSPRPSATILTEAQTAYCAFALYAAEDCDDAEVALLEMARMDADTTRAEIRRWSRQVGEALVLPETFAEALDEGVAAEPPVPQVVMWVDLGCEHVRAAAGILSGAFPDDITMADVPAIRRAIGRAADRMHEAAYAFRMAYSTARESGVEPAGVWPE